MISAFDVYLVMQLDSIRTIMLTIAIVSAFAIGIISIFVAIERDVSSSERLPIYVAMHGRLLRFAYAAAALFLLFGITPSTRTMATMIVLPAVTSDAAIQAIRPEAQELYDIAKDALRSLAKPDAKVEAAESNP